MPTPELTERKVKAPDDNDIVQRDGHAGFDPVGDAVPFEFTDAPPPPSDEDYSRWGIDPPSKVAPPDFMDPRFVLLEMKTINHDPIPIGALMPLTAEEVLRSPAFKTPQRTFATPYPELDALLDGGIKARQLTVIAAPTGSGKTGLGVELARSLQGEIPVLYCSTEIDEAEMAARVAGQEVPIPPGDILSLHFDPLRAADAVAGWPLFLHDVDADIAQGKAALPSIREQALVMKKKLGVTPAIIVDYLQQLASDDPERVRFSVGAAANQLRRLAREMDVPVIAISSVSRAYYGIQKQKLQTGTEEDPLTWLAAAKESGDVEFCAAVFIYLDTSNTVDQLGESAARLIVAKSRRGRRGFVGLRFHGPTGRFAASTRSVSEMGPAAKNGTDDKKVLDAVRSFAGQNRALVKNELRSLVAGVACTRVDAAIERLIATDKLAYQNETKPNAAGLRRVRQVIALAGDAAAVPADPGGAQ